MSYILDALQKSAAEENPEVAASMMRSTKRYRKNRLIGILIVLALLANLVVFSWLFWPAGMTSNQNLQAISPASEISEPTTKQATESSQPPGTSNPTTSEAITPFPDVVTDGIITSLEPTPVSRKPITLGDLPVPARGAFPDLEFSTHVYAPDPTLRAIVANGRRLTEGDRIEGLELLEITEEGVIFRYRQYLIAISILALWEEA